MLGFGQIEMIDDESNRSFKIPKLYIELRQNGDLLKVFTKYVWKYNEEEYERGHLAVELIKTMTEAGYQPTLHTVGGKKHYDNLDYKVTIDYVDKIITEYDYILDRANPCSFSSYGPSGVKPSIEELLSNAIKERD